MTEELKNYLISYCIEWRLPEETRALRRLSLSKEERERRSALESPISERMYGFNDEKTNALVCLGWEELLIVMANRILAQHEKEVINNCPKCGKLARTPKAKQCRYCQFDWH